MFKAPLRHFQCKLPHHLCLPHWTGDWLIYQMVTNHPIVSRTLSIHDATHHVHIIILLFSSFLQVKINKCFIHTNHVYINQFNHVSLSILVMCISTVCFECIFLCRIVWLRKQLIREFRVDGRFAGCFCMVVMVVQCHLPMMIIF
jgi:hypothetical protein